MVLLKENLNVSIDLLSIPVRGKILKRLGWDHRLQIQNLFMAFKRVPRWEEHWVNVVISGINPPLCFTLTLIPVHLPLTSLQNFPAAALYVLFICESLEQACA